MARVASVFAFVCAAALSAAAQEAAAPPADSTLAPAYSIDAPAAAIVTAKRPTPLVPLYGSMVALQALDVVSTTKAIESGAGTEANAAMQHVVGNPAAFVAVKAGTAAATIWLSEKLWRRNRVAAIALMVGVNVGTAIVAAHNISIVASRR